MNMFYHFRVEYPFDYPRQMVKSGDHEMSFKVVTPKTDEEYNKIAESSFRRPRFDYSDLDALEISSQSNQIEKFPQLSSNDGTSYEKRRPLDLEYAYDYPSYLSYKENDNYYNDQALPGHIVI